MPLNGATAIILDVLCHQQLIWDIICTSRERQTRTSHNLVHLSMFATFGSKTAGSTDDYEKFKANAHLTTTENMAYTSIELTHILENMQ